MLKENKIEHFKTDLYDIKFSPLAHLPNVETVSSSIPEDQNDLLFYSSGARPE